MLGGWDSGMLDSMLFLMDVSEFHVFIALLRFLKILVNSHRSSSISGWMLRTVGEALLPL